MGSVAISSLPTLLAQLPAAPSGKVGWPWTEESARPDFADTPPRIAVVTPSYQQAAFFEESIRSVLLQNYPNLQFIIQDGGSTDGSVEIIQKYSRWISCWERGKDKGQSDAINKGFSKADGDIYCWLNSDDFFLPGALWKVAKAYLDAADKDQFWLVGGAKEYFEATQSWQNYPIPFSQDTLPWTCSVCQPSSFWSSKIHRPLNERFQFLMDCELWNYFRSIGVNATVVPDALSVNRIYDETKTKSGKRRIVREFYQISKQYGRDPVKGFLFRYWFYELYRALEAQPFPKWKNRIWRANNFFWRTVGRADLPKDFKWYYYA